MAQYPVLEFDWKKLPHIADNIWQAQMAGWERILTYRGPLPAQVARGIRGQTMTFEVGGEFYKIPKFPNANARDEYPFACTEEGAAHNGSRKPWVGHVPPLENYVQGGMIASFIVKHGITANGPNRQFEVRVVNHPKGDVPLLTGGHA